MGLSTTHRQIAELVDDVVRVICVADSVGAAQQHLKGNVRNLISHLLQALPRAFVKEAQADVEGRAAPVLQRVQIVEFVGDERRNFQQVVGSHAGGEQRLMSVAERRVHQ